MRLKGRVDLPTSTQTSVPRTEYEISLKLSVACQENSSSLTQALILGLWKQKELMPYPIQKKQRGWERASCYNQNIPHSNSLLPTALPRAFRQYVRNRVSFRTRKLLFVELFLFSQLSSTMLWSLYQDKFIWLRIPCSLSYSLLSFIFKCSVKLSFLKNEVQGQFQYSPMLIKFRDLAKKRHIDQRQGISTRKCNNNNNNRTNTFTWKSLSKSYMFTSALSDFQSDCTFWREGFSNDC